MALLKCPDCGKRVSNRAANCPECGCPAEFFEEYSLEDTSQDEILNKREDFMGESCEEITENKEIVEDDGVSEKRESEKNKVLFKTKVSSADALIEQRKRLGKNSSCFAFGSDRIHFSNNVLQFSEAYDSLQRNLETILEQFNQNFLERKFDDGDAFLRHIRVEGQGVIDESLSLAVQTLVHFGIMTIDEDRIQMRYPEWFCITQTRYYRKMETQVESINALERNLAEQREAERMSRSRWQGGGFGVSGAIKGAVTAGALNMATDAFRSIGDSAVNASDANRVRNARAALVNDSNRQMAMLGIEISCQKVIDVAFSLIGKTRRIDCTYILKRNDSDSENTIKNLEQILDPRRKFLIVKDMISGFPFQKAWVRYVLENYKELDVPFEQVRELAICVNRFEYDRWAYKYANDKTKSLPALLDENCLQGLIDFGIEMDIYDECFKPCEVLPQSLLEDQFEYITRIIQIDWCLSTGHEYSKDGIEKAIRTDTGENKINDFREFVRIGEKYHIFDDASTMELRDDYCAGALWELVKTIKKLYDEAKSVRNKKFESIEEAEDYRSQLIKFEQIYTEGDTYADYDSVVMLSKIRELEKCHFKHKDFHDRLGELRIRSQQLKTHENSSEYARGRELAKIIASFAEGALHAYGGSDFLKYAKKAVHDDVIRETETDPFPIAVYDTSETEDIKGYVITERFFYNFNMLFGFGQKAILLDSITGMELKKNRLLFVSSGKNIKVKLPGKEQELFDTLKKVLLREKYSDNRRETNGTEQNTCKMMEPGGERIRSENHYFSNEYIFCNQCGHKIQKNAKFCSFCGSVNKYRSEG